MNEDYLYWVILWVVANSMGALAIILIPGRITYWFILGMVVSGIIAIIFAKIERIKLRKTKK